MATISSPGAKSVDSILCTSPQVFASSGSRVVLSSIAWLTSCCDLPVVVAMTRAMLSMSICRPFSRSSNCFSSRLRILGEIGTDAVQKEAGMRHGEATGTCAEENHTDRVDAAAVMRDNLSWNALEVVVRSEAVVNCAARRREKKEE